ncbi:hypothetical protein RHGRI_009664 [Rhododendron griersonianum]|uniref:MADS-box domain-containing protein n=1 Tax=Rhododendron griersonianum TaxID=479676 RepID=A0AAV6KFL4_9ERIC|nr:hypothetical protein RHGRI_009664 [Rhododendron griersonianum]
MGAGKRKIEIKKREKEEQRMVTFSKRRKGLFKKAHELHCLTGADVAVVAFSPAGRPYTHGEPSIDATIDKYFNVNGRESNNNIAGGGGEEYYCKKAEMTMMASWLEGLKVEAYESVDDLALVKNLVEEIRSKVLFRVLGMEEDFVGSLLA